jgi:hypothetical protein
MACLQLRAFLLPPPCERYLRPACWLPRFPLRKRILRALWAQRERTELQCRKNELVPGCETGELRPSIKCESTRQQKSLQVQDAIANVRSRRNLTH